MFNDAFLDAVHECSHDTSMVLFLLFGAAKTNNPYCRCGMGFHSI